MLSDDESTNFSDDSFTSAGSSNTNHSSSNNSNSYIYSNSNSNSNSSDDGDDGDDGDDENGASRMRREREEGRRNRSAGISKEALQLLKSASLAFGRGVDIHSSSPIGPLYTQLQSLRSRVPHTSYRSSCVILDTLVYLNQMKEKARKLKEGLPFIKIEVKPINTIIIQVHVFCQARNGVLAKVIEALEGLGYIFDTFDVKSCNDTFDFRAQCSLKNKDQRNLEAAEIKQILHKSIIFIEPV